MNQKKLTLLLLAGLILSTVVIGETFFSVSSLFTQSSRLRLLQQIEPDFDTLVNFRDLGDYTTRDGKRIVPNKLLRSAHLANLSAHDIDILADVYNVKEIIDFRAGIEVDEKQNSIIPNSSYRHLDLYQDEHGGSSFTERQRKLTGNVNVFEEMHNSYHRIVMSPFSQQGMREFFQVVLTNEDGAILWHCSSGKDRTGVAAAILLYILGVDRQTIYRDYMLTNAARKAENDRVMASLRAEGADEQYIIDTEQILSVRQEYIEYTFELFETEYHGIDNYIETVLGLSPADQAKIREMYLMDAN